MPCAASCLTWLIAAFAALTRAMVSAITARTRLVSCACVLERAVGVVSIADDLLLIVPKMAFALEEGFVKFFPVFQTHYDKAVVEWFTVAARDDDRCLW